MSRRTHHEYREPPLRYQTKPRGATKQYDTLGLYAYLLAFVVSVFVLAVILFAPTPALSEGQDRLLLAIVGVLISSSTLSLLIAESKEILR
jgi:hypothetical protein